MNATEAHYYAIAIHKYVPPICIVIGTVGHLLTILTVNGPRSRKTSFTVYLTALATVDLLVLYTLAMNTWLEFAFGIYVDRTAQIICKMYHYSTYLLPQLSSWLIMCLTIERTFCMYLTQKISQMPGPRVGLAVVGSIVFFLCSLNAHMIYGRYIVSNGNSTICDFIDTSYMTFLFVYWSKIHFFLYFVLPAIVILLGNSAIVVKVYQTARNLNSTSYNMKRRTRQVFLITLMISIAYLVLVTPLPLMFFIAPIDVDGFFETIFLMTLYLNHTINFFLYVLSGSRFREDMKIAFKRLFCKIDESDNVATISNNTGDY